MLNRMIVVLAFIASPPVHAQQFPGIPQACSDSSGTVALLDCLHNQKDILQRVLEYQQLAAKISELNLNHNSPPPQVLDDESADDPEPGMDRVNWFDQNLKVYAIAGTQDALIAYARLDGREYRLQAGDSIRLAQVTEVHPRGIHLLVSGHHISVGLSGLPHSIQQKGTESK